MLTRYLLEEPMPVVVMLGCLAFGLLVYGLRRRRRAFVVACGVAGVPGVVGAMVLVMAGWITTERELIEQRTREVVAATAPLNLPAINDRVEERAAFIGPNGAVWALPRSIVQELARSADRFRIEKQSIKYVGVEITTRDVAVARLGVRTTFAGESYRPIRTEWLLTWKKQSDDVWRISQIQWLKLQGQSPSKGMWQ